MTDLIVQLSKEERLKKAIELRTAGVSLTEIGKQIGHSKAWTCHLLKAAGIPLATITYDKNGSPRSKHGMRRHPTYWSWYSMKTRCGNPNHADYPNWGGREITYDPRWECFLTFLEDMGPRPSKKYSLERVDNSQGYFKENCLWGLRSAQGRNTRVVKLTLEKVRAIRVIYARGGVTFRALAKVHGVSPSHIAGIVKCTTWVEQ